jgi:hypothetical protein
MTDAHAFQPECPNGWLHHCQLCRLCDAPPEDHPADD